MWTIKRVDFIEVEGTVVSGSRSWEEEDERTQESTSRYNVSD